MQALLRDLRFGFRMLSKEYGFSLAVIFTLALGISANTAVFTVANALLLRPFPYRDPEQLISVDARDKAKDFGTTLLRYELVRDRSQSLQAVAVWASDNLNLTGHGESLQVPVGRVSPNFFFALGVKPQLGRGFTQEEGRTEGNPVIVISDRMWRSRFKADTNIIGTTVSLDAIPQTIVGVLPPNLEFPFVGETDIWTPRYFEYSLIPPQRLRMGVGYLNMIARVRAGTTLARVDTELTVLNQQYRNQNPTAPDASVVMTAAPLRDLVVADVRGKLFVLSASVAVLLLIACANVASLLLSRAVRRRREISVRMALGASRSVILRQLLTESLLLALVAGLLGAGLGWAATRALVTWGAGQLPQGIPIGIDTRVLLFTLVTSLLAGIFFGTFPALRLASGELETALREEGRNTSTGKARLHMNGLLVVGQVALSLLLLVAAGLLLRSFERLLSIDPGFDAHNVLTMDISLPTVKYAKPVDQVLFFDKLLRRVSVLPGVRSAAISAALPLSAKRITPVLPQGQPEVPLAQRPFIDIEAVSPQWFQTLRVPLVAGRAFTAGDDAKGHGVVIVNESFVRRYWPRENPVGKFVVIGRRPDPAEVIGVAADIRNKGLSQGTQAQLYLPFTQLPWSDMNLLVRTIVPPRSLISSVRAQVSAVDPDQPVAGVQTVDELLDSSRAHPRFILVLLVIFAAAALALSVLGMYSVLTYGVAQRRYELGIRMALGAQRRDILRIVLRQGLLMAIAGVAIGLIAALFLTRLMASLLYGVGALDLTTFVAAPLGFLGVALLASYLPARIATRVDPLETLRGN